MKSVEYICELDGNTRYAMGIARECSDEEWQVRIEVLRLFEQDCRKILDIFGRFWRDYSHSPDAEKAAFLKQEMLEAYPDFLANIKRQDHVTKIMDKLMQAGYLIVPMRNRRYIYAHAFLFPSVKPEDCFEAWSVSDPATWLETTRQRYAAEGASMFVPQS